MMYLERLDIRIAAVCIGAGAAILWSLRPRFDKFAPPGPRLHPEDQPKLFDLIDEVAGATGQSRPAEVYVVPDVNAFVTQRGGMLGFGSRRVMGLGLPLLAVLSVDELRAVLAHEFGHYHGGDVALGPLVYRTRSAIGRTLQAIGGTFVEQPFIAYGNLFLRVSSAVSRHQEFVADQVAATAVGREPLASGLRKAQDAGLAFNAYLGMEVLPVLRSGYQPPIASGFSEYFASPRIAADLQTIEHPLDTSPYDTHPPLSERLRAIGASDVASSGPLAASLISRVDELEFETFPFRAEHGSFKPIAWTHTVEAALLPMWREFVTTHRAMLKTIPVDGLPTSIKDAARYSGSLKSREESYVKLDELGRRVASLIGMAIAVMLHERGWRGESRPGMPVTLTLGEARLEPFEEVRSVVFGKKPLSEWTELCRVHGLAGTLGDTDTRGTLR
jgi:Zn-dependent protease with chaperone function